MCAFEKSYPGQPGQKFPSRHASEKSEAFWVTCQHPLDFSPIRWVDMHTIQTLLSDTLAPHETFYCIDVTICVMCILKPNIKSGKLFPEFYGTCYGIQDMDRLS